MTEPVPPRLAEVLNGIETPAYVCDIAKLKQNLAVAARLRKEAECRILLATKAFALPAVFPLMRDVLDGTTASGLFEAQLGREDFGKEIHTYAPAFTDVEIRELLCFADHIYFNSVEQLNRFLPLVRQVSGKKVGIRINPGFSRVTLGGELYDPCAPTSRFGVRREELDILPWEEIDVLHVHALCEVLHDDSAALIRHVGQEFGDYIGRVKAVNFGGGHLINKNGYNLDILIAAIKEFRATYNVEVILEPGGGLVYEAGYLVATVLDVLHGANNIAILDTSAACHMPDVLEVPYTPPLFGAAEIEKNPSPLEGEEAKTWACASKSLVFAGEGSTVSSDPSPHAQARATLPQGEGNIYILGGKSCMTGDVIGTYSFPEPLKVGDKLVFGDMMQYSFVKNNTFNGVALPDLALLHEDGRYEVIKRFGYEDFRMRLG